MADEHNTPTAPTWHQLPDTIILDLHRELAEFKNILMSCDPDVAYIEDPDDALYDALSTIVMHLQDKMTATGALVEYCASVYETFSLLDQADRRALLQSVFKLGQAIIEQLEKIGAWDPQGALWYRVKPAQGDVISDVVLVKEDP
jgi:hypothetical protein